MTTTVFEGSTCGHQAPRCTCGHTAGDHTGTRTSSMRKPSRGRCLIGGCVCTKYEEKR